jgi:hypothetical protein
MDAAAHSTIYQRGTDSVAELLAGGNSDTVPL